MDRRLVREAADALVIQDVVLVSATVDGCDGFSPFKSLPQQELVTQFRFGATGFRERYGLDEGGGRHDLLEFHYATGLRLVEPNGRDDGDDGDSAVLVEIAAVFSAVYLMIDPDVDDAALDEFARHNVGYHVWPYWREYAAGTLSRMRLPPVVIPFYRVQGDADEGATAKGR